MAVISMEHRLLCFSFTCTGAIMIIKVISRTFLLNDVILIFKVCVSCQTGSEHEIDDEKFPMEVHLVHKSTEGLLTVLGFLFEVNNKIRFYFLYVFYF